MRPFSHLEVRVIRIDSPPWANIPTPLPQLLVNHRQRANITQKALAKQIGTSIESVKNWESGRAMPIKRFWPGIRLILA
jgi:hypothetical protein